VARVKQLTQRACQAARKEKKRIKISMLKRFGGPEWKKGNAKYVLHVKQHFGLEKGIL